MKRKAWRCKTVQQQRDKASIYNSKEWHKLRALKLQANPICELCWEEEQLRSITECIHHIHPIEDSASREEMRKWAFMWDNLQSLCNKCHAKVHNDAGYHTKEAVQERKQSAFERWKERQQRPPTDKT